MPPPKKPEQYHKFEKLTKGLMSVPKEELDKEVSTYNAKKAKQKKRPDDPKKN